MISLLEAKTETSFVYHGTDDGKIKVLEPYHSDLVNTDAVFAAKLFDVAVAMANHWSDDDFDFGKTENENILKYQPYVFKEKQKGNFKKFFRHQFLFTY